MTSKEFFSRSASFSILDKVAALFISVVPFVYRCCAVSRLFPSKYETYISDLTVSIDSFFGPGLLFDTIYFEYFSFDSFLIQYRYFKSFVSRLSSVQLDTLRKSGSCSNLFLFFDYGHS